MLRHSFLSLSSQNNDVVVQRFGKHVGNKTVDLLEVQNDPNPKMQMREDTIQTERIANLIPQLRINMYAQTSNVISKIL